MMRSMYSGVAGLKTHQTKMDVIGNNIANVNTVAYKSQSVTFSELMYQTTQAASGANAASGTAGINARQIGLGVKTGAINTAIDSQGASQTTNNPFDIRITGDAFFVVSDGSNNFFTRDGSFYVDGLGNLAMTSNGYNVMGWGVDESTGDIKQDTVKALRIMSAENMTYEPEATTKATVSGILDKNDTSLTSTSGKIMNLMFYDKLGYAYTAKFNVKNTDADGTYTVQLASIIDSENNVVVDGSNRSLIDGVDSAEVDKTTTLSLVQGYSWDETTTPPKLNSVEIDMGNMTNDKWEFLAKAYGFNNVDEFKSIKFSVQDPTDASETIEFGIEDYFKKKEFTLKDNSKSNARVLAGATNGNLQNDGVEAQKINLKGAVLLHYDPATGKFNGIAGKGAEKANINLILSAVSENFEDVSVDFSKTTMFNNSGVSTMTASSGDNEKLGAGRKLGNMSGVTIQQDGRIYASYDNGMSRLLGQIAAATFANASGLMKEGDNLYAASQNSGEFDGIGVEVTTGGGYMTTGVLEMSNVDLSAEFTEMITTQRGFQANSRIITVSDTLLEELVNLKR
ncbi:flagellar hook protein FlgE [Lacrimispora saccharolytica]|uniref:flagellar hook protein FlgE n=1 Tax=Lacrimispora saccharolytica TaxID=84030 RepID=UPI00265CF04D|nr:flagellar hook-basal body complex protein [Lacrimispora saccharolytica]MCF2655804.1 flagellar hook-basal body complex protein [Lacrimispora saccharolytica]